MPEYDAADVIRLGSDPLTRNITRYASQTCLAMAMDDEDVWDAIAQLDHPSRCEFRKSMPSNRNPAEILDVYDVVCRGRRIYMKLKISTDPAGNEQLVVLSFKNA